MLKEALSGKLIFVQGKGGVGKSCVAHSLARHLARHGHRTLLVSIDDPLRPPGSLVQIEPRLEHLNNEAMRAFEEYAGLKIGVPSLVRIFLQNRLMQYLAKAAPGVCELVLMGKIWHERLHYDRIVVDMPATGHGITMFQAIFNWGALFGGSPLAKDAKLMIETLSDPLITSHVVVSLPEEMPLVEALELRSNLRRLFPGALTALVANRLLPGSPAGPTRDEKDLPPLASSAADYVERRLALEKRNLGTWQGEEFFGVPYFVPVPTKNLEKVTELMTTYVTHSLAGGAA